MQPPVALVGLGEMGGVFARGLLRSGHPVYPIIRGMDPAQAAAAMPEPEAVLVAVAERDVHPVMESLPEQWHDRLCLLQNELLPQDWERHGVADPTVISVWFEKKRGQDVKVIIPSPARGPHARLLETALGSLDIPTRLLETRAQLLFELVLKNLYILTTNIAGLQVGGTVGDLWAAHRTLAREVADEVMDIQAALAGTDLDREGLIRAMVSAFAGDPDHKCMGRSAPARLARALEYADRFRLDVPRLRALGASRMG